MKGSIRTAVPFTVGQRHTTSRLEDAAIQDLRIYGRALSPEEVQRTVHGTEAVWLVSRPANQRSDAEKSDLFCGGWVRPIGRIEKVSPAWPRWRRKRLPSAPAAPWPTSCKSEARRPRRTCCSAANTTSAANRSIRARSPASAHARGTAEEPAGLGPLALAPENPLVARVVVNRFWQEVMGTGIVRTPGDFGAAGEMPTHPELLDWLAVEFRESGWDVKKFFRLLLTSATYRQSAAVTAEKLEKDPQNRFLSRGPRFRMDAEMVRDYALAASGLLVKKIGGPSVKPYQPPGVWEAVAMIGSNTRDYRQDAGESSTAAASTPFGSGRHRRRRWISSMRPAARSARCGGNGPNTPLQALVTLNDPQFVEAARDLAH